VWKQKWMIMQNNGKLDLLDDFQNVGAKVGRQHREDKIHGAVTR